MTRRSGFFATRVCLLVLAGLASATSVQGQTTALVFDSQPGDYIGQGVQRTYTPADGTFAITPWDTNGVSVSVTGPSFSFWWSLDFFTAEGVPLTVGSYGSARRFRYPVGNGLDVSGSGRGCNQTTGRFDVREIVRAPERYRARVCRGFRAALRGRRSGTLRRHPLQLDDRRSASVRGELSDLSNHGHAPQQRPRDRRRCGLRLWPRRLPGCVAVRRGTAGDGDTRFRLRLHRMDWRLSRHVNDVGARQRSQELRRVVRATGIRVAPIALLLGKSGR